MRSEETGHHEAAFEEFRKRGLRNIETGELDRAAEDFAAALEIARAQLDPRRIDLALCNWAAAVIELGQGDGEISRLREVLLRNSDPVNCRMAAYDIARYYELKKNYKKALFYARITRDRSEVLGRRDWLASSYNLIGNTLLAESFVQEAAAEYERALELVPTEPSPARGQILDNLGYCRTLQGDYQEGYRLLYEGLRLLRRFGARLHEISARLDLCFIHLETGRYRLSQRHGLAALKLAEAMGDRDSVKNALYLLGEVANLNGDLEAARGHFTRLQRDFFPESGYLPQFLLAVDIRRLVNLHA
jgi:tetratricopeptide (TPR) repeat protein